MTIGQPADVGGPAGYSYRGLVVRAGRDEVLAAAAAARFSGWVGSQEGDDVVLVPSGSHLLVASGGRDLEALGAGLTALGPVLVVEVVRDRLLSLVLPRGDGRTDGGEGGAEPLRYLSDPSVLDGDDLDEPRGAHHAGDLARAFDVPAAAGPLREVLAEGLDPEHYIESERLGRVLSLLGLPVWLVAAWSLPRRSFGGPDPRTLTRLRAGVRGPAGWVVGPAAGAARRVRQRVARRPDGPRPDGRSVAGLPDDGLW